MTDPAHDILDRRGRLIRFALATLIGGIITFFALRAMVNSGRGPSQDPIGQAMVVVMGAAMFALTSVLALTVLTRIARARRDRR